MVKKLMESIREQKKNSILAMVTISGEVVFEVIIPLLMANLIDYGIDMGDMGYIVKMGIVLLLSALGQLFCGAISGKFAAIASSGFARNLRHDMFYKVQNYSFSNIDKFSTASIVTRLTTDVTNLQNTYQMIIRMAVRSPLMAIFSLVAAFGIDAKLSLIFLAIIPVLVLGLYFIMTRTHPIFERVFRTYDKLNSVVQENLHGIRVVKSFVREDHENKKFTGISENIYKDFKKAEQQLAWNAPLMQLCMYAAVLLLSWFGARTIVACGGDAATGLSTGELLSLLSYATQILMSLMGLSMIFVMLTMSRTSGERVVELLNETPDITTPENAVKSVPDGSIDFEHVQFSYRHGTEGKPVLSDINLHIPAGATVGVIGGTGSSKSSFVQLIPRLYDVDLGAVKVGGIDVRKYDLDTLRGDVAMVLQKNVLFSGTIKDNLRGRMNQKRIEHYDSILPEVAKHSSEMERRADEAERETDKLKKVEYMEERIGQVFEGVISGVQEWGFYVELPNTVEGLVHVTSLTDDFYHYEESSYEMIGERTNKHYKLGQKVKVIVADTDKIMRTIDFRVVRDDVEPDEAVKDEASVLSKMTD